MPENTHPTVRFRVYARVHGLDAERSRPGSEYVRWIRARRREFGSHAAADNEAFVAWLERRYPETGSQGVLELGG
jgi:hypothetical protein